MLNELKKKNRNKTNIGNKIKKNSLGITEIKILEAVSNNQETPAGKESFSSILGESNQLNK